MKLPIFANLSSQLKLECKWDLSTSLKLGSMSKKLGVQTTPHITYFGTQDWTQT